jgi:hypothetical protein
VDDQRVSGRTLLDTEDPRNRRSIEGVRPKSIHGFRWKRHEATALNQGRSFGDGFGIRLHRIHSEHPRAPAHPIILKSKGDRC